MKDIYELIRQKESEFERVQKEVEALRIAVRLLDENSESRTTTVHSRGCARFARLCRYSGPASEHTGRYADALGFGQTISITRRGAE